MSAGMPTPAPFAGSCLCGAVRFAVALPTRWITHCHCRSCRRAHGAPIVTWAGFDAAQVVIAAEGTQPRWHASSPGTNRGFCPECGTPMFYVSDRWPGEVHVARTLLEHPLDRAPDAHEFFAERVPWLDFCDALPKKPGRA